MIGSKGTIKKRKPEGPTPTCFSPNSNSEKKHDDQFSISKKSLLRNTKSDKLYILGM